jgi:hypothetical protein
MTTPYSIPNRPSGSDVRSVGAIITDFDAVLAALNSFDGGNLQANSVLAAAIADAARLGLTDGATVRRGKSIIATTESRTNVAYGTLATPDKVAGLVLPTDGLIFVSYQATWQESVLGAARAAIFIGANQLKTWLTGAAPAAQETQVANVGAATDTPLITIPQGLNSSGNAAYTGDVTTGQSIGVTGPIKAAAGTYDISVQFKSTSGSVTAKNRELRVWSMGF